MPVTIFEAALYKAHAERQLYGVNAAVAISGTEVLGIGLDDARTPYDSRSAIINLIQNHFPLRNDFVAASARPSERCLGMAQMQGIHTIAFAENGLRLMTLNGSAWGEHPGAYLPGARRLQLPPVGGFLEAPDSSRRIRASQWFDRMAITHPAAAQADAGTRRFLESSAAAAPSRRFNTPRLEMPGGLAMPATVQPDSVWRDDLFMRLAFALLGLSFSTDRFRDYAGGHNIGCVLRGPGDELLGWGLNSGATHSTLHGEVNLIQNYHRRHHGVAFPQRCRLYTTLEPCHMCGGMLSEAGEKMDVRYGQADPGIIGNALVRNHRGSSQAPQHTITGINLSDGHDEAGGPITAFLASDTAYDEVTGAIDRYFTAEPQDADDRVVWANGMALLRYVNPIVDTLHGMARRH